MDGLAVYLLDILDAILDATSIEYQALQHSMLDPRWSPGHGWAASRGRAAGIRRAWDPHRGEPTGAETNPLILWYRNIMEYLYYLTS